MTDIIILMIMWLSTVAISYIGRVLNEMRIFKIVADNEHTIDLKSFKKSSKTLDDNEEKKLLLELLIPGYNLGITFKDILNYNNLIEDYLMELKIEKILVPMTEIELKEYRANPTILNAISIMLIANINVVEDLYQPGVKEEGFVSISSNKKAITEGYSKPIEYFMTREEKKESLIEYKNELITSIKNKEKSKTFVKTNIKK